MERSSSPDTLAVLGGGTGAPGGVGEGGIGNEGSERRGAERMGGGKEGREREVGHSPPKPKTETPPMLATVFIRFASVKL